MIVDSLGFQTDLIFHRFSGLVLEYDDYLVIKTPSNPHYFWGNLIYFKNPPEIDSVNEWKTLFEIHFKSLNTNHMTFAWDSINGETGVLESFLSDGFDLDKSITMVAENIKLPAKFNPNIEVRPIYCESEWSKVLDHQVSSRASHFEEATYKKFAKKKLDNYKLMIESGLGQWMGAFLDGELIGDLGLFVENGLGRFQNVSTHPHYRRLGVCSTLLYQTSMMALDSMKVQKLIIVADPFYHALKIYESLGFDGIQTMTGMCKFNKDKWVT